MPLRATVGLLLLGLFLAFVFFMFWWRRKHFDSMWGPRQKRLYQELQDMKYNHWTACRLVEGMYRKPDPEHWTYTSPASKMFYFMGPPEHCPPGRTPYYWELCLWDNTLLDGLEDL